MLSSAEMGIQMKKKQINIPAAMLIISIAMALPGCAPVSEPVVSESAPAQGAKQGSRPGDVIWQRDLVVRDAVSQEELLLEDYLKEILIPTYGISVQNPFHLRSKWFDGSAELTAFLPEEQKGLVGYEIFDFNFDGKQEMLVTLARSFSRPKQVTVSEEHSYQLRQDGIEIKLFQVGEDGVAEMDAGRRGIGYRDTFSYSAEGSLKAFYLPIQDRPLILIVQLWEYQQSGYPQTLLLDVYEIEEDTVTHVESMCDAGGTVTDLLPSSQKVIYNCAGELQDMKKFEKLYPFMISRLSERGVDGEFLRHYYESRSWQEDTGTWEAHTELPVSDYIAAPNMENRLLMEVSVNKIDHNPYVKLGRITDSLDSRRGLLPLIEHAEQILGDLENLSKVPTLAQVPRETLPETEEPSQDMIEEESSDADREAASLQSGHAAVQPRDHPASDQPVYTNGADGHQADESEAGNDSPSESQTAGIAQQPEIGPGMTQQTQPADMPET